MLSCLIYCIWKGYCILVTLPNMSLYQQSLQSCVAHSKSWAQRAMSEPQGSDLSESWEHSALSRAVPVHKAGFGCRCILLETHSIFTSGQSHTDCWVHMGILRAVFLFAKQITPTANPYAMTTGQRLISESDQEMPYAELATQVYCDIFSFIFLWKSLIEKIGPSTLFWKTSKTWNVVNYGRDKQKHR